MRWAAAVAPAALLTALVAGAVEVVERDTAAGGAGSPQVEREVAVDRTNAAETLSQSIRKRIRAKPLEACKHSCAALFFENQPRAAACQEGCAACSAATGTTPSTSSSRGARRKLHNAARTPSPFECFAQCKSAADPRSSDNSLNTWDQVCMVGCVLGLCQGFCEGGSCTSKSGYGPAIVATDPSCCTAASSLCLGWSAETTTDTSPSSASGSGPGELQRLVLAQRYCNGVSVGVPTVTSVANSTTTSSTTTITIGSSSTKADVCRAFNAVQSLVPPQCSGGGGW